MSAAQRAQMLQAWFSPGYPVGAFAYSHGLEWAIERREVADAAALSDWIHTCLTEGSGWNDAILLVQAAGDAPEVEALADLSNALSAGAERYREALDLGDAFARVTTAAWGRDVPAAPYPVAVGCAARVHGVPVEEIVPLYLHAFAANLVSVAVRLVPLGQTDGQAVLAAATSTIAEVADRAVRATLDDLGGLAQRADLASLHHETQHVRLYRT
ncbi:MAG: urease accessory UreF family protein [Pseudomonadota bacterium]